MSHFKNSFTITSIQESRCSLIVLKSWSASKVFVFRTGETHPRNPVTLLIAANTTVFGTEATWWKQPYTTKKIFTVKIKLKIIPICIFPILQKNIWTMKAANKNASGGQNGFENCHSFLINWQRAHAVWCLSSKNRLDCFVSVIKSYQHFNSLTFTFLAGTKLHVHGVNCSRSCLS